MRARRVVQLAVMVLIFGKASAPYYRMSARYYRTSAPYYQHRPAQR